MNQIILASHGNLAKGMKDTLNMIIGDTESVKAFSSYRDEDANIGLLIEEHLKEIYNQGKVYILTDIFGGSVNNEVMNLIRKYPDVNLIAGMNLPLVISIATNDEISEELLEEFIRESQGAIVNCNCLLKDYVCIGGEDL
jgi:fructoselysine/glucoselysine PTS system EIIA component